MHDLIIKRDWKCTFAILDMCFFQFFAFINMLSYWYVLFARVSGSLVAWMTSWFINSVWRFHHSSGRLGEFSETLCNTQNPWSMTWFQRGRWWIRTSHPPKNSLIQVCDLEIIHHSILNRQDGQSMDIVFRASWDDPKSTVTIRPSVASSMKTGEMRLMSFNLCHNMCPPEN